MRIHLYFEARGIRGPVRMETRKEASSSDRADATENGKRMEARLEQVIENLFEVWRERGVKCERGVKTRQNRVTFVYRPARRQARTYWEVMLDDGWLKEGHPVVVSNLMTLIVAVMGSFTDIIRLGPVAERLSEGMAQALKAENVLGAETGD